MRWNMPLSLVSSSQIELSHLPDYLTSVQTQPPLDEVHHSGLSIMEKTEKEQIEDGY